MAYTKGYSPYNHSKYARNVDDSPFGKVQKQYWFTKSAVIRKFGKEDECFAASDAELDAKLELFKTIENSAQDLQNLLADYQNKICVLAQEQNTLGRFLKEYSRQDSTKAGKMMSAVGKGLSYTAQQQVSLRTPLVRLFQEVETFYSRAVEDTARTVAEMEKVRTEYRGALLWMKDISRDINPEHYQQMEKFREVQNTVKQRKTIFEQLKVKCIQKIDLLGASRCNMFSNALILYQNQLIAFSDKTAKTLQNIASAFQGYHSYDFQVIKDLRETIVDATTEGRDATPDKETSDAFDSLFHNDFPASFTAHEEGFTLNDSESSQCLLHLQDNGQSDPFSLFCDVKLTSESGLDKKDDGTNTGEIGCFGIEDLMSVVEQPAQSSPVTGPPSSPPVDTKTPFMPSYLIDFDFPLEGKSDSSDEGRPPPPTNVMPSGESPTGKVESRSANTTPKVEWYKVFQDIDPLSDSGTSFLGKSYDVKKC